MVNLHRGAFAASASAWAFTTGLICSLHIASNGATLRITCKMQVTRKGNIAYVLLCCIIAAHSQHASHEPGLAIVCVHPPRSLVRAKFHARGPWSFHQRPGTPPLALLAAVVVPIAVFLVAYWTSRSF